MKKVLTFYVAGELFGIDINIVKEITRNIEYTPLLNGKKYIKGLMNLRGNIVTIFNLEAILCKKVHEKVENLKCIVLKSDDNDQIGFLVDKTGDVIDVEKESFSELPENMIDGKEHFITKVIKEDHQLLKILDFQKILQSENY